jgi:hypothetical protein
VPGHSIKMTEASASDYAHDAGVTTAEAMGGVAVTLARDQLVRGRLRKP